MARVGKTKNLVIGLVTLMLAAPLAACDDGRSGAEAAAKELASSLSALDVGSLAIEGTDAAAANQQLKDTFAGLGDVKPSVESGELTLDGSTATVPLDFTWNFGGTPWEYSSQAELTKSGDEWAVRWEPALLAPRLEEGEKLSLRSVEAPRGQILGAGDAPIVQERPVLRVGLDKTRVPADQAEASARALAELLGLDPDAFAKQTAASGAEAFVEGIVLREYTADITAEKVQAIPGAVALSDTMALAPTRTFARPLLGSVGLANAEQIEKSNGALQEGDSTGTGGLQQQYDAQLRGKDGVQVVAAIPAPADGSGTTGTKVFFEAPPTPGTTLKTTLDLNLQQLAEDTLAGVGPASAIVALRPSSGAVLAAASGPGSNGYNTAMLGQYAPGSTFKIIDSLAMFRNGMTADSTVQCTPTITVDGRTFRNAPGYPESSIGGVTLRDAFAHSCNTAFIAARDQVTQAQLESAAMSMGVAVEAPRLGAAAFLGSVPGEAEGTEHAASMIGQGKVLMSPLTAAIMAGSVAKGAPVSPQLVLNPDDGAPTGTASGTPTEGPPSSAAPTASTSVSPEAPSTASDKPITAEEAAALGDMMRAVVTSGHAGFLSAVPGAPVGAKTGTAEFGSENPPKTHAWIVAVHGDLAVAVFVEEGGLGAEVSGPLLQKFLTAAG
ncbi:penicillin-binding transpeptidase domain-containing protein [Pseudarthrobacter sp. J64]|uniref:penicillin-binding transpeptidase domain-containing protein n=1 Tax=Pseudarthrobacter sp. J64 TaxID=3116485 RepID=UPI002E7FC4F0|nr:penicillin-binding transpeptidase domain-containing protein [Pseudarthrobacter sp. J64]MEE2570049.1 penicillin-binding transpeptidase domain-containing protein [Pseudarthrobacter sp. J64]